MVGITALAEKLPAFIVITEFPVLSVIAINEPFPSSEFSLELGAVIYVCPAFAIPDSPPNHPAVSNAAVPVTLPVIVNISEFEITIVPPPLKSDTTGLYIFFKFSLAPL